MSEQATFDEQVVGLLEGLGDRATYHLLRKLLRGPATQDQLEDESIKGLDQSGVSRRLKTLGGLGLVRGRGRRATHSVLAPEELFEVFRSMVALAEAINSQRANELQQTRGRLATDELKGAKSSGRCRI